MDLILKFLFTLFLTVHVGYLIIHLKSLALARWCSWILVLLAFIFSELITREANPIMRMVFIITSSLFSLKSIVTVETYLGKSKLNYFQWLAFSAGWFGMRPKIFEKLKSAPLNDVKPLLVKGITRIIIGLIFLLISNFILNNYATHYFLPGMFSLIGFSFILHFGILNISTALWRLQGVDCKELFKSPGLSMSLKEFWGKRWNQAFSEMTAVAVYRPLKDKTGKAVAIFSAFLFSGVLHEIAISVPVKTGYGLPLLYFCIHGLLMQTEEKIGFVRSIISNKITARVWVMFWLIVPMPLLFHKEFILKIVFPLMKLLMSLLDIN